MAEKYSWFIDPSEIYKFQINLEIATPAIKGVSLRFLENRARAYSVSMVPILLAMTVSGLERIHSIAYVTAVGRLSMDIEHEISAEQKVLVQREIERLLQQPPSPLPPNVKHPVDEVIDAYQRLDFIAKRIQGKYGDLDSAIHASLASLCMNAWTTFEVLAGDLWIAVVNLFPLLGVRALDAEILSEDSPQSKERKSQKQFSVIAQRVLEPDFDIRKSMGDLLIDTFPMVKWARIVAGYKAIFREQEVADIICDRGVRTLAAVRNAFVHNAGRADEDFIKQAAGDKRFDGLGVDDPIALDATITLELMESAIKQGVKLLEFADRWCVAASGKKTLPKGD